MLRLSKVFSCEVVFRWSKLLRDEALVGCSTFSHCQVLVTQSKVTSCCGCARVKLSLLR